MTHDEEPTPRLESSVDAIADVVASAGSEPEHESCQVLEDDPVLQVELEDTTPRLHNLIEGVAAAAVAWAMRNLEDGDWDALRPFGLQNVLDGVAAAARYSVSDLAQRALPVVEKLRRGETGSDDELSLVEKCVFRLVAAERALEDLKARVIWAQSGGDPRTIANRLLGEPDRREGRKSAYDAALVKRDYARELAMQRPPLDDDDLDKKKLVALQAVAKLHEFASLRSCHDFLTKHQTADLPPMRHDDLP